MFSKKGFFFSDAFLALEQLDLVWFLWICVLGIFKSLDPDLVNVLLFGLRFFLFLMN